MKEEKITLSLYKKLGFIFFIFILFYILNASSYLKILSVYNVEGFEFNIFSHMVDLLIYLLINISLYTLTNKLMLTTWISSIFYFFMTFASVMKVSYSLSPIYISDFAFINGGAGEIIGLVNSEAIFSFFKECLSGYLLCFLILALFTYLMYFIDFKFSKKRFLISLFSIGFLFILFIPSVFKLFINYTDKNFDTSNLYSKHGLFAGIYGYELSTRINEPENYDEQLTVDLLNFYESNSEISSWGNPDVIVVLSEAFFDVSKISEISFNEDVLADFNYVKDNSIYFNCVSPTYGGRTGNIEFEYNTLTSLRYLSDAVVPYNTFYSKEEMTKYPSIANIFNENNYTTNIYSPFDNGDIYKVKYVYEKLGYKNRYFYSDIVNEFGEDCLIDNRLVSDEAVISKVISDLKENDSMNFSFVKTVQNHMPYDPNRYNNEDFTKIKASCNNNEFSDNDLSYFSVLGQGIYENGKSLRSLYEYVQSTDKPTVVVFFGDHLPLLSDEKGADLLQRTSFLNTSDKLTNLYNQYTTEGLIFANYDIDTTDLPNYVSFDFLSAYILSHLDIDKGDFKGYINYLYDSKNLLSACNKHIFIKDDKTYFTENMYSNEVYNNINYMEYYYLNQYYKN